MEFEAGKKKFTGLAKQRGMCQFEAWRGGFWLGSRKHKDVYS